ncbi:MAG: DUF4810 domain-containing protein [Achromobacter pulmonis]|uniref:DUF4810 domain-containing protein n=1 Tax=Achromobacter pulmonis TaxID=1389932 RepID=A0A6S7EKX2_9BURK|nr:DUF4810 domain-containing protein [Achromobacter pulmonis]CAB3685729.1 hypothetical protein LMG26696_04639 [Achromobacter pulmonis]CAB3916732.1 hypothetical protein LMG26788_05105 [Achromobacter pulmonis]
MSNNLAKARPQARVRAGRILAVAALATLLGACAQQPKSMYSWQSYQPSVYAYLKEDGADYAAQSLAMEKNIETVRATNAQLPPGFRAHLGMLYLKMGEGAKGLEQLEGEKAAFPESKPFMDFLLRNASKTADGVAPAAPPAHEPSTAPAPTSTDAQAAKQGA